MRGCLMPVTGKARVGTNRVSNPLNVGVGEPLNPREIQILDGMARGLTAPRLGAKLGVTEHTIRTYTARIRIKLGAVNAPHAVALGFVRGYLKLTCKAGEQ